MDAEPASGGGATSPMVAHFGSFLTKCYDIVDDPSTDGTVSWGSSGNSFVIRKPHVFAQDIIPKFFKHNMLSSFVRQLNTYGFLKVDPDRWEFANMGFQRGQKHLLKSITRSKPAQHLLQPQQPQGEIASSEACVEVGNSGLDEEIERLMRDKNVLMQEFIKLRQQQQNTDHQLHNLTQHIQGMEQNQQQVLSCLAMIVKNPGVLALLVQQNGSNWWMAEANKKRRVPALEQGFIDGLMSSTDGQIAKYQPFVSEMLEPGLMPTVNADESANSQSVSGSVLDLCVSLEESLLAADPSWPEEGFLSDFLDYYHELASLIPGNNGQIEPAISDP